MSVRLPLVSISDANDHFTEFRDAKRQHHGIVDQPAFHSLLPCITVIRMISLRACKMKTLAPLSILS